MGPNPSFVSEGVASLEEIERKLVDIERSIRRYKKEARKMLRELKRVTDRRRELYRSLPKERADEERRRLSEELLDRLLELLDEIQRLQHERAFIRFVLTLTKECQGWGVLASWYCQPDGKLYLIAAPATITTKFRRRKLLIDGLSYGLTESRYLKRDGSLGQDLYHWVLGVHGLRVNVVLHVRRERHGIFIFLVNRDANVGELAEAVRKTVEEEEEGCMKELECSKHLDETGSAVIECGSVYRYRNFIRCSLKRTVDRVSSAVVMTFPPS